jgi:hypothetical protein
MTPKLLCSGEAQPLVPFASEVFKYTFEEQPDYSRLKFMLIQILLEQDITPNDKMDWSKHNRPPPKVM